MKKKKNKYIKTVLLLIQFKTIFERQMESSIPNQNENCTATDFVKKKCLPGSPNDTNPSTLIYSRAYTLCAEEKDGEKI